MPEGTALFGDSSNLIFQCGTLFLTNAASYLLDFGQLTLTYRASARYGGMVGVQMSALPLATSSPIEKASGYFSSMCTVVLFVACVLIAIPVLPSRY